MTRTCAAWLGVIAGAIALPAAVVACREEPPSTTGAERATGREVPRSPASPKAVACKARLEEAERGYEAALRTAARDCKTDADCTIVDDKCWGNCRSTAIATSGVAAFARAIEDAKTKCDGFAADGCAQYIALPSPSCVISEARCRAGECKAERLVGGNR